MENIANSVIYFILERCLLLVHKRLTIQTTNTIKDVANEGHISPDVMGILAQNLENAIPLRVMEIIYTILLIGILSRPIAANSILLAWV